MCYAPINVNPAGSWEKGVGILCLRLWSPPVGLLIVQGNSRVGTCDFDRQKSGINSEAVAKICPRGFLKVKLLEKGMKFSFVLIAIIQYFKLSSKQIMSILRKFLSSSSHLIVKLVEIEFHHESQRIFYRSLIRPVPSCWADVIKHCTFH